MEKRRIASLLVSGVIAFLGLMASGWCVAAEFKRSQAKNVKVNGKLCYLEESGAFHPGVAALICLCIAHIVGNIVICRRSSKAKAPWITSTLVLLSWMSFVVAVILMGAATSMNRRQPYGGGWLDGKCYLVKAGVYIASAVLVMLSTASTLASIFIAGRRTHAQQQQQQQQQQQK